LDTPPPPTTTTTTCPERPAHHPPPLPRGPMDKNIRILIVDDFSTMRRIVKNLLNDLGFFNTVEADDGTSALVELRKGPFDLVITDWNMPGMPGIDLLNDRGCSNPHEPTAGPAPRVELRKGPFDQVITRWNLPGMSGIDLLSAIGGDAAVSKGPVLRGTAEAKREQIIEAAQAGGNG